jgi:hypothetical protein
MRRTFWSGCGGVPVSSAGNTKFESGNETVNIVGTSTFADATTSGTVLGTDLVAPFGFLSVAHTSVIIHISTK